MRHKIGMRRVAWKGFRYFVNFTTTAVFFGLIWAAKPSTGRSDYLQDVRVFGFCGTYLSPIRLALTYRSYCVQMKDGLRKSYENVILGDRRKPPQ